MSFPSTTQVRWLIKPLWFSACLAPFIWMNLLAFEVVGSLGPDPIEETQDFMGIWGLRMLLLTLALTPLRQLTGWLWLIRVRRMTGLFALFYASMHLLNYLGPDQGFAWMEVIEDIIERPFITLGAAAVLGLTVLGITSTQGWQRRLGRKWQTLHRSVYVIAILVVWHFWWQVKADITEPAIYAAILSVLLIARVIRMRRQGADKKTAAPGYPDAANQ